jgi:hypothetical protein
VQKINISHCEVACATCTPASFLYKSFLSSERANTHFLQVTPTPSGRKTLWVAISLQCEAARLLALLTALYSALCLSPGLRCVLQVKRRLAKSIHADWNFLGMVETQNKMSNLASTMSTEFISLWTSYDLNLSREFDPNFYTIVQKVKCMHCILVWRCIGK